MTDRQFLEPRSSIGSTQAGLVSLLIPVYNHASSVRACLDSVLASDTRRIELILSDDASLDGSAAVVEGWLEERAHRFASATLLRQPRNLGITENLKALTSKASGEYITLLASDDLITPAAVDVQRDHLDAHRHLDFLFANVGRVSVDGSRLPDFFDSRHERTVASRRCSIVDVVCNWSTPWGRVFARRTAFVGLGDYPEGHTFEDRWNGLRIVQTGRYGYLPTVVYLYRLRGRGTGTAGLDPRAMYREFWDAERIALQEARGLMKLLLTIRVKAANRAAPPSLSRGAWWIVSNAITRVHRMAIRCRVGSH